MFERAPFAPFERCDQTVDFGTFRLTGDGTRGLQPSDEHGEIACIARRIADSLDRSKISAAERDERSDVFERAAQPARSSSQIVQGFTVEAALFGAPAPRFERRDALVDQSGGPGVEIVRCRFSEKCVDRATARGGLSPRG
jgi:hypothetical protein